MTTQELIAAIQAAGDEKFARGLQQGPESGFPKIVSVIDRGKLDWAAEMIDGLDTGKRTALEAIFRRQP